MKCKLPQKCSKLSPEPVFDFLTKPDLSLYSFEIGQVLYCWKKQTNIRLVFELMQRRPLAQQDSYMTSCTRSPELLPLSSSTWRILHENRHSLECGPLGSSSIDQIGEDQRKLHENWPPKKVHHQLPQRPSRVACYSKAKVSCWRTARNRTTHCGGTTVRNSRLFPRMTSIAT